MQQTEDFQIDWSKVKKPELTQKIKPKSKLKQAETQMDHVDPLERIQNCFRYRLSSLMAAMGKHQYYCVYDPKIKKTHPEVKKSREDLIKRCSDCLELSCRFVSRSSFLQHRHPLVKLMKIDLRTLLDKTKQDKDFQLQYDDLDDQDEDSKLKVEEQEKKLAELEPQQEEEIRSKLQAMRKNLNLQNNQKIYIMQGEFFEILKQHLNSHGWVENPDIYSQVYDFKFCYAKKFLQTPIQEQIVSRFQQTKLVSTKFGLTRSLRNSFVIAGVDSSRFYPRCYDLSDEQDFEDFIEEYKFTFAENYLKKDPKCQKKVDLCLRLLQRKFMNIQEKLDAIFNNDYPVVTPKEWELLQKQDEKEVTDFSYKEKLEIFVKQDPQFDISKGENIWVIKPCGMSRGRGIKYFRNLEDILPYAYGVKEVNFVAQKCVENIMTISKRKFDIRQWVIISDIQNLNIWFYEECYIRFCGVEYSTEDLKNRYAHLTNFSVQKHNEEPQFQKLMFTQDEFIETLNQMGHDFKQLKIRMQEITIATFKCCQKAMEQRKNTFELFGLDFIVDEKCQPWLIEINSSPTFGISTPVTERLVEMGLKDLGVFIVDHMFHGQQKKNFGGWNLIYKKK